MGAHGDAELHKHIENARAALPQLYDAVRIIQRWAKELATTIENGGTILIAGNGGSASEAQHFAAELVGRFDRERKPLPAIALNADTAVLTAVANDDGFHEVYARQVRALGRPGDVLILLSSSGRSVNVITAARAAQEKNMIVWAITGPRPNDLAEGATEAVHFSGSVATIQEMHLIAIHLLCMALETSVQSSNSLDTCDNDSA